MADIVFSGVNFSGGFAITAPPGPTSTVEYLVVGGGGGGGGPGSYYGGGGGGGAGGFNTATGYAVSVGSPITVTVGAGGAMQTNGNSSVFGSITSSGGGYGAVVQTYTGINGGNGASGGGGSGSIYSGGTGGTATPAGQGNSGGSGDASNAGSV